jgi:hypothetical protein
MDLTMIIALLGDNAAYKPKIKKANPWPFPLIIAMLLDVRQHSLLFPFHQTYSSLLIQEQS